MAEKPTPKPDDDTYSDEEAAKRRDATLRAMIGMKPKPHKEPSAKTERTPRRRRQSGAES